MDAFEPQAHVYRFYEDGTESGSSPIAAEDVNVTGRDVNSDSQFHLRFGVQEVGGGSIGGDAADDYTLEYRKNGGGAWAIVPATSGVGLHTDSGSTLTDGNDTTDRATDGITDGNGSFVAGEQSEVSEASNRELTADNFTEHVFALLLISDDLIDGDFFEFRLRYNGGAMDNVAVPRITVAKDENVIAEPGNATLTSAGAIPTVLLPIVVAVGAAALNITGQIPSLAFGPWAQTVPKADLTVTGQVPTLAFGPWVQTVPKADLSIAGQVPTIEIAQVIAVAKADLSIAGQAPVVEFGPWLQIVPKADLVASGKGVTLDDTTPVGKANLVVAGQVPTVDIPSGVEVPVGKADLVATGQTPVVLLPVAVAVGNATLSTIGQAPTLPLPVAVQVAQAALSVTGQAPSLILPVSIEVGKADLSVTGQAATLSQITIPVAALGIVGQAPTIPLVSVPDTAVVFAGLVPSLPFEISRPGVAAFDIVGQPVDWFMSVSDTARPASDPRIVTPTSGIRSAVADFSFRTAGPPNPPARVAVADFSTRSAAPGLRQRIIEPIATQVNPGLSLAFNGITSLLASSSFTQLWGPGDEYLITFWIKFNEGDTGAPRQFMNFKGFLHNNSLINLFKRFTSGGSPALILYNWLGVKQIDRDGSQTFDDLRGRWVKFAISAEAPNTYIWSIDNTFVFNFTTFLSLDVGRQLFFGLPGQSSEMQLGPIYLYNGFVNWTTTGIDDLMDAQKFAWNPLIATGNYTQADVDKLAHWIHPAGFGEISRTRFGSGVLDVSQDVSIAEDSP